MRGLRTSACLRIARIALDHCSGLTHSVPRAHGIRIASPELSKAAGALARVPWMPGAWSVRAKKAARGRDRDPQPDPALMRWIVRHQQVHTYVHTGGQRRGVCLPVLCAVARSLVIFPDRECARNPCAKNPGQPFSSPLKVRERERCSLPFTRDSSGTLSMRHVWGPPRLPQCGHSPERLLSNA